MGDPPRDPGHAANFAFNTAIAAVMELVNEVYRQRESSRGRTCASRRHGRLADLPLRPHLGAEVYERLTGRRVWRTLARGRSGAAGVG